MSSPDDDAFDAGDPEAVKARGLAETERRRQETADIRAVMRTPGGRRFTWRQLAHGGAFTSSFVANSDETAFNEGRRAHALWLLTEIEQADKGLFTLMWKENGFG